MRIVTEPAIAGKRVLVRLDLDVPIENGLPTETVRLDAAKETLELLVGAAQQIILCGHLGRPDGKPDQAFSVKPLQTYLEELIGHKIAFSDTLVVGTDKVTLLENLRFYEGEEKNDPQFIQQLASLADVFVFEAFGVAHRDSASTVGVAKTLPSYAGYHVAKEVVELSAVLHNPIVPFVIVLGGAKIETKLPVMLHLEDHAEAILIGGLLAKEVSEQSMKLPENCVVAELREDGLDITKESIERFTNIIAKAQTIVWNGPLGKFEEPTAAEGTKQIAAAIIGSGAYTIVGGGDTVAAVEKYGILDQFDFVSVGGGAMLSYLAGQALPALEILQ